LHVLRVLLEKHDLSIKVCEIFIALDQKFSNFVIKFHARSLHGSAGLSCQLSIPTVTALIAIIWFTREPRECLRRTGARDSASLSTFAH
jgi:hypothetical protein